MKWWLIQTGNYVLRYIWIHWLVYIYWSKLGYYFRLLFQLSICTSWFGGRCLVHNTFLHSSGCRLKTRSKRLKAHAFISVWKNFLLSTPLYRPAIFAKSLERLHRTMVVVYLNLKRAPVVKLTWTKIHQPEATVSWMISTLSHLVTTM